MTPVRMVVWAVHTLLNPASGPQCCPDDRVTALDREYLMHLSEQTGETKMMDKFLEHLKMNVTMKMF